MSRSLWMGDVSHLFRYWYHDLIFDNLLFDCIVYTLYWDFRDALRWKSFFFCAKFTIFLQPVAEIAIMLKTLMIKM